MIAVYGDNDHMWNITVKNALDCSLTASLSIEKPAKEKENDKCEEHMKIDVADGGDINTVKVLNEGSDKKNRADEAAILPTDIPTSVSAVVCKNFGKSENIESSSVSLVALPTLTLSVIQSNLKQTHSAASVQMPPPVEKDQVKGAVGSAHVGKGTLQSSRKVAPILPTFSQTLDPKLMAGNSSTGLFGKAKEKHWKLTFLGDRRKCQKKEQEQPAAAKESHEKPAVKKHKSIEGIL